MANLNKVLLMGNLTRDPELRYLPSGQPVCKLGLEWMEAPAEDHDTQAAWDPDFLDGSPSGLAA